MALVKCPECGKEISDKASNCPGCGYPIESQKIEVLGNISEQPVIEQKSKKLNKKIISIIAVIAIMVIIVGIIYNIKVAQPRRIEAQNKATYEEAIELLENGKYEDGGKLLKTITGYKDVDIILEQIKWEVKAFECITEIREQLKNPDSLQIYEVSFYNGYKVGLDNETQKELETLVKLTGGEPVCIMHISAQNGFGGNTTSYLLFLCKDGSYHYMGSCDDLETKTVGEDDEEELIINGLIKAYKDNLEEMGDVNLSRIKTVIKNDSYSTIKLSE